MDAGGASYPAAVDRLVELAPRFAFGFFVALGLLTLTNRFFDSPSTFGRAAVIALGGGLVGLATTIRR